MTSQYELPYKQTAGYVERDASKVRALREAADGTLTTRLDSVLHHLSHCGTNGATWTEVAQALELHHGQASGALSTLHRMGLVFTLRSKRHLCHPYVHASLRTQFADTQRHDDPTTTRAGVRKELLDLLFRQCVAAEMLGYTHDQISAINEIVDSVRAHDRHTK